MVICVSDGRSSVCPCRLPGPTFRKTGPLWFAAALMTGGLVLFAGAIWMHQVGQERGLYSYQTPKAVQVGRLAGDRLQATADFSLQP